MAKSPRQAMQSMPGMLSKLESDFQQRAKTIDPWLSVAIFFLRNEPKNTTIYLSKSIYTDPILFDLI